MKNVLWIAVAAIGVLLCLALFYFQCLPVSAARLRGLQPGMTTNEVANLLGPPQEIDERSWTKAGTNDDMYLMWIYESPAHFFAVEVFFDRQGHYTRHWKD
jgi:hypothetical protein